MRVRGIVIAAAVLIGTSACSGGEPAGPDAGVSAGATTSIASATTAPTDQDPSPSTTTTVATTTTVTTTTTTSTTTATTTTTAPTTTRVPSPPVTATTPPTPGCPTDLFLTRDEVGAEFADAELAVYEPPSADPLWRIPLGYDTAFNIATDTRSAYVLLGSGTLISLGLFDCAERWRADLGSPPVRGGVALEDGVLVVTAGTAISAFDASTGNELWTDRLATEATAPVIRASIATVAGTSAPWLRSYWMPTGERLFDVTTGLGGPIESMDADFDAVYMAGAGTVEGRWIDDGAQLFSVASNLTSAMRVFESYVYVTGANQVAALDFDVGEEIWRQTLPDTTLPDIGLGASSILVFTLDGNAHRLDFDNGTVARGGSYGAFRVWPEFDDDAFTVFADDDPATVYSVFEQEMFPLPTGATGIDRFTELEISGDVVVTFTYSAERF